MNSKTVIPLIMASFILATCQSPDDKTATQQFPTPDSTSVTSSTAAPPLFSYIVPRTIRVKDYFPFMDSLVRHYDSLVPYQLTEHLLVRSNPRIIDTLEDTDYYCRMARGEFVYDQRQLPVLHQGDTLYIPDSTSARALLDRMAATWIDVNIPEFTLRVVEGQDTVQCMTIRVGQNKKRYQEVLGRVDDLRTRPGIGTIVRINRAPSLFYDPHTGRRFIYTKRDDGRTTRMPLIPWMEPEINGIRMGQMIHPTTNPETLGKAYSNGCIGCTEGEAWRLYYHAPEGTKVVIRYDLLLIDPVGDTTRLPDIYGWAK
ncbi:MAG: L,D-transpeptidase [Lewinellaceae bacterium]|nr:L,D-transpeptidase [Saprospiraceae bacterium]MCB9330996.1 L,D-transpeptidase [Lewinellaceae bacterium]